MSGSKYVVVNPGATQADGGLMFVLKASAIGGGITVVAAQVVNSSAGTFNVVLQNYGSSGTVAGGTVAGMASGTATVWASDVPQAMTLTAANVYIDAGEYLVAKNVEGDGDLTVDASIMIEYVDGPAIVG